MKTHLRIKTNILVMVFLIATFALRSLTDAMFVSKSVTSAWTNVKFITVAMMTFLGLLHMLLSRSKWKNLKTLLYVTLATCVIALISAIKMMVTGYFSSKVVEFSIRLIISATISVIVVNVLSPKQIRICFSCILCCALFIYLFIEVGPELLDWKYIQTVSFSESYSPFESHYTAMTAITMCAYFSYYRENRFLTVMALIFNFLVFKRLCVVFGLIFFLFPVLGNKTRYVSNSVKNILAFAFILATVMYYYFLIPENQKILTDILNIRSLTKLTSYRSVFFTWVYNGNMLNYGYGSIETFLGRMLEMELLQLFIETSILSVIAFSFCYWNLAGNNIYGVIIMLFEFLNLLTSHNLHDCFSWGLVFVVLYLVDKERETPNTVKKYSVYSRGS